MPWLYVFLNDHIDLPITMNRLAHLEIETPPRCYVVDGRELERAVCTDSVYQSIRG